MAEMKNICGKIPVELHEKVRAEIEEKDTSTQIFIQQVIEEHFNRLEGKGEESMEKRTLAVQVTEDLFQRVKWAVAKEGIKQKDFLIFFDHLTLSYRKYKNYFIFYKKII